MFTFKIQHITSQKGINYYFETTSPFLKQAFKYVPESRGHIGINVI